MLQGLGWKQIE